VVSFVFLPGMLLCCIVFVLFWWAGSVVEGVVIVFTPSYQTRVSDDLVKLSIKFVQSHRQSFPIGGSIIFVGCYI
jgi:hypothetical protein